VVIHDLDRKLAHGLPNLSKQLRSRLRNGSSTAGLAHLANHTCCPHHRNSELQILSVWQEDRTSAILQGPTGDGPGASNSTAPGRTLMASLRATKLIRKGTSVITCYRNTSAGTPAQLMKDRETLSRMFQCSCCLYGGSCGVSSSEVGLGNAAPSFLLDPEVPASGGSNTESKPVGKVEIAQQLYQDCHQDPLTGGLEIPTCARPKEAISVPTAGLPTPMQLKWCSSADKRKTSRLNPMGNKPARRSRPSEAV